MGDDDYDIKQHLDLVKPWSNDLTEFLARYYTLHYHRDLDNKIYVRQAPNKVCILGITEQHPAILTNKEQSLKLEATLGSNANVKPDTVLCEIVSGDARYAIKANMYGKLLEINPRILESSELLLNKPETEGYLAVIKSQYEDTAKQLEAFTSAGDTTTTTTTAAAAAAAATS
ncbi:hypothetical protein BDB00DRAFT_839592 [Zychaea mexicana]|uniref:uncharacterized protein n=1 Tax=Zychaea mexicana TaxID=64656 RepID=UPI0022FDF558|nr:uncharacterized protein BDB00DRAFT_839592 [Zychaea mexicana]KAI9490095.1 hypothetical protein BDB00DRAFT_839592 [Zychaea mexicana]